MGRAISNGGFLVEDTLFVLVVVFFSFLILFAFVGISHVEASVVSNYSSEGVI